MLGTCYSPIKSHQLQRTTYELDFILKPWANLEVPQAINTSENNDSNSVLVELVPDESTPIQGEQQQILQLQHE